MQVLNKLESIAVFATIDFVMFSEDNDPKLKF